MQVGQRLGKRADVGAVEGGRAEQDLDAPFQDIFSQAVPEVEHGSAAPMLGNGRRSGRVPEGGGPRRGGGEVEFGLGIEATGGGAAVRGQDAVGADHMGAGSRVNAAVDEEQVDRRRGRRRRVPGRSRGRPGGRRRPVRARRPGSAAPARRSGPRRGGQPHDIGGLFDGHRFDLLRQA